MHNPLPVVVSVSVTDPAVVSAFEGWYTPPKLVFPGVNVPVPDVVHIPPVAIVIAPVKGTFPISAQID